MDITNSPKIPTTQAELRKLQKRMSAPKTPAAGILIINQNGGGQSSAGQGGGQGAAPGVWGSITGEIGDQTDLAAVFAGFAGEIAAIKSGDVNIDVVIEVDEI